MLSWYKGVDMKRTSFRKELETLINSHCKENGSNTPDFILAEYLLSCLNTWDKFTIQRDKWYGHKSLAPGNPFLSDEYPCCCEPVKGIEKYKKG
jgi:hypothetical protein